MGYKCGVGIWPAEDMTHRFLPLWLAVATLAYGYDFKSLKPQGYVSDFAGVIDTASKVEIERYCRELEDRTGAQLAFVTIATLENEPVSDVANLLYRTWGIGQKKSNEGALLLLVVQDRKSRLEVGYGLEPILPDGLSGSILREMRPALRENPPHYGDAMIAAARSIGGRVMAAKGVAGGPAPMRTSRRREVEPAVPMEIWIFLAIIVLMFFLNSRRGGGGRGGRGGGIFPIFFPPSFPGSSRGGGGFGGMSDSGGGFGGFGGGDSGGGGTSGDW